MWWYVSAISVNTEMRIESLRQLVLQSESMSQKDNKTLTDGRSKWVRTNPVPSYGQLLSVLHFAMVRFSSPGTQPLVSTITITWRSENEWEEPV